MSVSVHWDSLVLGDFIGIDISALVDVVVGVVDTLATVLSIAAEILELVATLLIEDIDLVKAAVLALVAAIEAAIEFLTGTSIGLSYYVPKSFNGIPGVRSLINKFASSITDQADPNRPTFVENEAHFLWWFIVAAEETYPEASRKLQAILELLGIVLDDPPEETSIFEKTLEEQGYWPPVVAPGGGEEPNWQTFRLSDVGVFRDLVVSLKSIAASVYKIGSNVEQIRSRIELIQERAILLQDSIDALRALLESIATARESVTGLHSLVVRGQANTSDQQAAFLSSKSAEDFPFKEITGAAAAGVCLHLQAADGALIDTFETLFGLYKSTREFTPREAVGEAVTTVSYIDVVGAAKRGWNE
jgi:hypothetical protein